VEGYVVIQKRNSIHRLSLAVILMASIIGNAAEFSEGDVQPQIETFVLTADLIAVAVSPGYEIPAWEKYTRFFVASRSDYEFTRVSGEQFSQLLALERYERRFGTYPVTPDGQPEPPSWRLASTNRCSDYDYESGANTAREFSQEDSSISVEMSCKSEVSRAISVEDELWIGTYREGEFGLYGSEGLLIASLDGKVKSRIAIRGPIEDLVRDPWSSDIWVLSEWRISVLAQDHTVLATRWPAHRFDERKERPDVFLPSSSLGTDPLAVIAYTLGEAHYQKFYQRIRNENYVPDRGLLYKYFTWEPGVRWADPVQLPVQLQSLLKDAEPTWQWRRFACMLNDERAETLCDLDIKEWPKTQN
jgi:hypothetical protein